MDLFPIAAAVLPIIVYLLVLAFLSLRRRPTVQTGFVDSLLLGLAASGVVMVGPLDLFLPSAAAYRYGMYYRAMLLVLYSLIVLLVATSRRPRMVIYNQRLADLQPILKEVITDQDHSAVWAGRSVYLPNSRVDFAVDGEPVSRTIQLVTLSPDINFAEWTKMRRALTARLKCSSVTPRYRALWLLGAAATMAAVVGRMCATRLPELAQSFREWMLP